MNYGAEPADQVVRYSLEGMEYSLKITGNVAKHVANVNGRTDGKMPERAGRNVRI